MIVQFIPAILGLLDKVIPDQKARDKAKVEVMQMQQNGELEVVRTQMSAILAEAQSADPWTSRARPSFMYVMYIIILWSIPMGVLTVFNPTAAGDFTVGFTQWVKAIPEEMWWAFTVGYLGYAGSRTIEKVKGVSK